MINKEDSRTITFRLGDMIFEYDEWKNEYNIEHHGISFKHAARVFFDYDRIELYDEDNSKTEDRYDTIGDLSAGYASISTIEETVIGNVSSFSKEANDIIFVVYTERIQIDEAGEKTDITRLISARFATNFERGLYYGKC
ncbi:MAG: BrnT family toxin [Lachnospiraceae bacterium]|nr:BrnT family toxin [Lachnospiraceae bacterium]